jgi:hypothetical protein
MRSMSVSDGYIFKATFSTAEVNVLSSGMVKVKLKGKVAPKL